MESKPKPSRVRLGAALRKNLRGEPVNLSPDRAAKIKFGGQEVFVWCDTYRGRLRLRVVMPDGGELEHLVFEKE